MQKMYLNSLGKILLDQPVQLSHSSSDGAINSDFGGASALRIISADNFLITDCKFSQARLPDGYDSQIFRLYAFCPSGLRDYGCATLRCKI